MKKDSVNNIVGTNVLYGRARRIDFIEKATYIVIAIISIVLVFVIVGKESSTSREYNVRFSVLREYMEARGFGCELVYQNGGACTSRSAAGLTSFIRYDDGFEYIVKSDGFFFNITYTLSKGRSMNLKTTAYALEGYRNMKYTCHYKDSVIGELDYCADDKDNKLDSPAYLGVVEKAMYDLNNILSNSGYKKDRLIEDCVWEKK